MPQQTEIMDWRGCEVVDQDGDKVGKLDEIYIDRETGEPEWAIVNTGLFGRKSSFVPLKDAMREGEMIRIPYQKEQIKEAPSVDPDGEISQEEEQQVYAHYGLDYSQKQSGSGLPQGQTAGQTSRTDADDDRSATAAATGDAPGQSTGDAPGQATGDAPEQSGSGLRLQRMTQEDIRLGAEGDEVVERRAVQETRITSDDEEENR